MLLLTRRRPSRDSCGVVRLPLTVSVGCVHKVGFVCPAGQKHKVMCAKQGLQSTDANMLTYWHAMYRPTHVGGNQASLRVYGCSDTFSS